MKAVTWQGVHDMQVTEVPDPRIEEPTDAIIKITSTGLCGSDLHLYETLAPFMEAGDIVGHEPMGIVEEVGSRRHATSRSATASSCRSTSAAARAGCATSSLYSQCETTQNHEHGTGASFFGYSKLYGQVPGGQAEYLRVPFADFLPVKVPHEHADDRFLFLSDVLPTAWQGLQYADVPDGGTLLVLGAGPIGDMAARMGVRAGHRVISVDRVPERLARVEAFGAEPLDLDDGREASAAWATSSARPPAAADPTPSSTPSAWRPTARRRAGRAEVRRPAARRDLRADDEEGRPRPARRPAHRHRRRTPRRHHLDLRRLRRPGRPDADDAAVRQADPGPDGPGQRARAGPTSCSPCSTRTTRSASTPSPPTTSRSTEAPDAYEHFQKKEEGMVKVVFQP